MPHSPQIKICGLTKELDLSLALEMGADYLGFILYPKSPRALTLDAALELIQAVKRGHRVVVDVDTSLQDLAVYDEAGFDFFQIHVGPELDLKLLQAYAEKVGPDRLWLAPRFESIGSFPVSILPFADTILVDTFSKKQVGGTGKTGNWEEFRQLKEQYPDKQLILAGGLNPENVLEAIAQSGTLHVDINSGIETEPGSKDASKMRALFAKLRSEET
ncbi:MAG: phosphoribosylanthranilate isomerase [Verrucomicrobiota bacterium]